jgi:hypothetical protein
MRRRTFLGLALALAVVLAAAVSPFAASSPDGLERVAADEAFLGEGRAHAAPVPGYAVPGVADERLATGLAGLAGALGVFALGCGVAVIVRRRGASVSA